MNRVMDRILTQAEIDALLAASNDGSNLGTRDTAIIALAVDAGLRRAELTNLNMNDCGFIAVDEKRVAPAIIIYKKESHNRSIRLTERAHSAIVNWIAVRKDAWGKGPLFFRINKGGTLRPNEHLSTHAIAEIITLRGAAAGIDDLTPGCLRCTYASSLFAANMNIATIHYLLGNTSLATTAKYDRRANQSDNTIP